MGRDSETFKLKPNISLYWFVGKGGVFVKIPANACIPFSGMCRVLLLNVI